MQVEIGIDLVGVDEVREAVERHGSRYLERVYTPQELRDCDGDPRKLAARFAAKEAAIKALRSSDDAVPWGSIELASESGRLRLSGEAAEVAVRRGISGIAVSLAWAGDSAAAVVLAETT